LRTIVVVIVVITVFIALFLHCTFKIYSAIRLSSRNKLNVSVLIWKSAFCKTAKIINLVRIADFSKP